MKTLVGASVLTAEKELSLLARVNKEKFAAVAVGGGSKVLLTPHGELPGGLFLDPSGQCALEVDHKARTASKTAEPLSPAQLASLQGASSLRDPVDSAMQRYCASVLPSGVVTTYGSMGAGVKVVCCSAGDVSDLSNYWAGQWLSEWSLEVPMGGSIGQLTGKVSCNVHYFEDGNVQLDDKVVFQCELPAGADEVGPAFAAKVREYEQGFIAKLEDIFQNMSDSVLKGLRRRLPITGNKFDWDKNAVAKLARDLGSLAATK